MFENKKQTCQAEPTLEPHTVLCSQGVDVRDLVLTALVSGYCTL